MIPKNIPKNWKKVKGYNGLFSPDNTIGYTEVDIIAKNKQAVYIGSFKVELLKKLLNLLEDEQTLKFFVEKGTLKLMPCVCDGFYLAPRDKELEYVYDKKSNQSVVLPLRRALNNG